MHDSVAKRAHHENPKEKDEEANGRKSEVDRRRCGRTLSMTRGVLGGHRLDTGEGKKGGGGDREGVEQLGGGARGGLECDF